MSRLDPSVVAALAAKEFADSRRNRWFLLYAAAFAVLALALAWLGLAGVQRYGLAGFGRTAASLVNLVLLIVPLMGLTLGALSLAGEREKGTLLHLMAQPVLPSEILLGKFLGLTAALVAALGLGFGASGVAMAAMGAGTQAGQYLGLLGLALLLALASLGLGFALSAATSRAATALGLSIFAWLTLVFFGDLGLMGTSLVLRVPIETLFGLALLNPLQVFKMAAVLLIQGSVEVLGPAGVYALRTFGSGLLPLFLALLVLYAGLPVAAAGWLFRRRGAL